MLTSLFGATLFAGVAIQSAIALPAISVKGSKFFANGQQFFLKGNSTASSKEIQLIRDQVLHTKELHRIHSMTPTNANSTPRPCKQSELIRFESIMSILGSIMMAA